MEAAILPDRFIDVKGIKTRYWAAGDKGSAVVLVHGLGGFIENWMYNIMPLAAAHRVYALDLLGFGQTQKTPLVRDIKILIDFIKDFMQTLEVPRAALVGNSLGGGLSLQFALEYPEMVEKLVLADTAGMGREVCPDFRFCAIPVLNSLFVKQKKGSKSGIIARLVYDPAVITQEFADLSYKYNSGEGAVKALLSALTSGLNILGQKSSLTRPLLDKLGAIKVPTLIIWGKQDAIIPVSHAHIAAQKIPGARLEIFDKCGHIPMYEQPDKFNQLVLEFLDK